ncbi:GTP pyrophosphokinase [Serratia phage Moabite]|uniref:GTP pyrophosphokinase n=2 Tax=Moabitevirus moabite TaxID=2846181 RepID=A0A4Y5TPL2_9CAUD|nr:phosphohydrolase [Serratia phage Moabite]QDB71317.1 GTP pyrophosphokinase [Serratia phage Moabite]QPX76867.1 putative GTP pyrophosphokinase [Serratia phage vB_SmaM_Yaphecito]UGO54170.1 putative phosphohydrolase [Serratia phage vB_SmaM_Haymo]
MEQLIEFAKTFAIAAHSAIGQKRKGSDIPYWRHPEQVANIVSRYHPIPSLIAAAWLHDVLEDTQSEKRDIAYAFLNSRTLPDKASSEMTMAMKILTELTDEFKGTPGVNRLYRVSAEILRHSRCDLDGFWVVKIGDVLSNLSCKDTVDLSFLPVFLSETYTLMTMAPERIKALPIYLDLMTEFDKYEEEVQFKESLRTATYRVAIKTLNAKFPKPFTQEQLRDYFTSK